MARVLVIEDNPANMRLACLLLRHATHTVLCAVDAESGLLLARTEQPDLVLMDMQLPDMDGLTATAQLKRDPLTAAIPVIALTALAMKSDQENCQAAGCDGYIAKPLRYQELYAAINALLPEDGKPPAALAVAATATRQSTLPQLAPAVSSAQDARLILVAEDNPINQKLILQQLALLGFAANVAVNGRQAFARWQSGEYALLLTDLQMPEMNGYALTAAIRSAEQGLRRIPIVALTANLRAQELGRCRAAGMDDCLSKPLQLAELKASLVTWLPGRSNPAVQSERIEAQGTRAAPLDVRVLEAAVGRDAATISRFLHEFRGTLAAITDALIHACRTGDAPQSAAQAHNLKSSALAVGAQTLGELCARIEAAGHAGSTETLSALIPMFEQEVDAVDGFLQNYFQPHAEHQHNT